MTVSRSEVELTECISNASAHRVWGYVRVSSKSQEDNQSLDAQEQAIIEYCAKKKLGTPHIVVEIGSATKQLFAVDMSRVTKSKKNIETDPRPLFLQLISHITQVKNSHLVVFKLDRFARVSHDQEMIMNLLRTEGTTLHSTQLSEANIISGDGDDPARIMMRQIFGAVAQYEAGMIQIRMEMGRRHKSTTGGYTGGRPPFGYRAFAKELKVDKYEAEIVRIIFDLRLNHAYTQSGIVMYINAHKSDDAPEMNQQRVSRILSNTRLYNGYYTDPYYGIEKFKTELTIIPEEEQTDE